MTAFEHRRRMVKSLITRTSVDSYGVALLEKSPFQNTET